MNLFATHFSGARARWSYRILPLPVMAALGLALGALLIVGCSDDEGSSTFPEPDPPTEMDWLFAVYGTDANNVYAAGNRGAMFHFDGTDWSPVDLGATTPITEIWGPGDGTLLACGHEGKIWRNTGGSWSSMESGTSQDLYGLGNYQGDTYATGREGTLRILNGSSWNSTNTDTIIVRNLVDKSPIDTLRIKEDIYSITTVNYYFFGGAFEDPDYVGEPDGMVGTDGMILGPDDPPIISEDPLVMGPSFDWWMRTLRGDQLAESEWVLSTNGDGQILGNNYLGTSEGWIFQLKEDLSGLLVWDKFYPDVTDNPGAGIRDIWLDESGNLFFVTDEGDVVYQTQDYDFSAGTGVRKVVYDGRSSLTSIWGADTDHIYFVGLIDNAIFQGAMDFTELVLNVNEITVEFPAKGKSIDPFTDELGRPRF